MSGLFAALVGGVPRALLHQAVAEAAHQVEPEGAKRERNRCTMALFEGDDWAEDHHDVQFMNEAGERLAARRLSEGVDGITVLHGLMAEHTSEPHEVAVGIET